MSPVATLAYAFTLGLVAALNPCGFPLLPAYLALFVEDTTNVAGPVARTRLALVAGACMSGGFLLVFGIVGFAVSLGLDLLTAWIGWVMVAVGCAMVALGVRGVGGAACEFLSRESALHPVGTAIAMGGFGVAYAVASVSCALPLFLAAVSSSTERGPLPEIAAFIAYAAGMGLFVTAASLVAAHLGASAVRRLRPLSRWVPRLASALVIVVGLYLVCYWTAQLTNPLAISPITQTVDAVQSTISSWISSAPLSFGSALFFLLLCALLWASRRKRPVLSNETRGRRGIPIVSTMRPAPEKRAPLGWFLTIAVAIGVILIAAIIILVFLQNAPSSAPQVEPGINQKTAALLQLDPIDGLGVKAPPFALTDQNGSPMSLKEFAGHPVVLTFNDDECTDLCTLLAQDLTTADHDLGSGERRSRSFPSTPTRTTQQLLP